MTDGIPHEYIKGGCCIVCGKAFEGNHLKSKKTCGDTCRQQLTRYRKRITVQSGIALDVIDFFETISDIDELEDEAISNLIAITTAGLSVLSEIRNRREQDKS